MANEKKVFSYQPEGILKGDFAFREKPIAPFAVFNLRGDRTALPEHMLCGGFDEWDKPELTLATALLAKHPIFLTGGTRIVDVIVQRCPQGIFSVEDKLGHEWTYVLRTAHVNGEIKMLYGLDSGYGTSWGYFDTVEAKNGDRYVKGKAVHFFYEGEFSPLSETKKAIHRGDENGTWRVMRTTRTDFRVETRTQAKVKNY